MIDSISYKLIIEQGSDSEKVFEPNKNLIEFLQKNNSRIFKITASNSQGKSFLLNLLSLSFFGLTLSEDELIPSLKREIEMLSDQDDQSLVFDINLKDPDGFKLNSSFNNEMDAPEVKMIVNESEQTILSKQDFFDNYVLMYDIPEKPLERIYKIIKNLKGYNRGLIDKMATIEKVLDNSLKSIENQKDDSLIEQYEGEQEKKENEITKNKEKLNLISTDLDNLYIYKALIKLSQSNENLKVQVDKKYELEKVLKSLPSPKEVKSKDLDNKILKLKGKIESMSISDGLYQFIDLIHIEENGVDFIKKLTHPELGMVEELKNSIENFDELLFDHEILKISEILKIIDYLKTITFSRIFNGLEGDVDNEEFYLLKSLLEEFERSESQGFGDNLANSVFNKSVTQVIEGLNEFGSKYKATQLINDYKNEIKSVLLESVENIEKAKKLSKQLVDLEDSRSSSKSDKKYYKLLSRIEVLTDKISRIEEIITDLKNGLEKNGVYRSKIDSTDKVTGMLTSQANLMSKYIAQLGDNILNFEKEKKEMDFLINLQEEKLIEIKYRISSELEKGTAEFAEDIDELSKLRAKIMNLVKYITLKDSIIKDDDSLDFEKADSSQPFFTLIGDFVASQFDNKVLYQDKYENISTVDYTSKVPYFITQDNRRISFQRFSGGQQSSNYLKAKLNKKAQKKHIVLFDEVANMDNESQSQIIDKLKEMESENRLMLAILVEPHKEPGVFNIQSY